MYNSKRLPKYQLALDRYRHETKQYLIWADKLKRKYGWEPGKQFDEMILSDSDWNKVNHRSSLKRGMEIVLGLTSREIRFFEKYILAELNNDTMDTRSVSS